MYIRRKVFSVALDENGEERYFSTNEIINEEDYLDEVMYSDYDEDDYLDEYMYSDEEEGEKPKKKLSKGEKAAIYTGAGLTAAGGGIYGAKKLGRHMQDKAIEKVGGRKQNLNLGQNAGARRTYKVGGALAKPAEWIEEGFGATKSGAKKAGEKVKEGAKKAGEKVKEGASNAGAKVKRAGRTVKVVGKRKAGNASYAAKQAAKRGNTWVKGHAWPTAAGAAAVGAGLTAAGIYGAKKLKERRAEKDSED